MISLFGRSQEYSFRNGEGVILKIASETQDVKNPHWFADTYLVSRHLSKGDRSTAAAVFKAVDAGDTPNLLTAKGSATQELWSRMTEFGYLEQVPSEIDVEGMQQFSPVLGRHGQWMMFMLATRVSTLTEQGVARLSKGLAKSGRLHVNQDYRLLQALGHSFTVEGRAVFPVKRNDRFHSDLAKLGVLEERDGMYCVTMFGTLTMPFYLDHIMHRKA